MLLSPHTYLSTMEFAFTKKDMQKYIIFNEYKKRIKKAAKAAFLYYLIIRRRWMTLGNQYQYHRQFLVDNRK